MNDKSTPESEPKKLTRADLKEAYIEWFCGEQPADPDFSGMADDPAYQREAVEMAEGLPPMGSLTCLTDPAALIAADTSTVIVAEIKNRFEKELDRHLSGNACDRTVQAALSDEIERLKGELEAAKRQSEKDRQSFFEQLQEKLGLYYVVGEGWANRRAEAAEAQNVELKRALEQIAEHIQWKQDHAMDSIRGMSVGTTLSDYYQGERDCAESISVFSADVMKALQSLPPTPKSGVCQNGKSPAQG
jgi:hypothetical protein